MIEYDEKFCKDVIEFAKHLNGPKQWCAKMLITEEELEAWREEYPEFDRSCKLAKLVQEFRWIDRLKVSLNDKSKFNTAGWTQFMQNEFGWSSKQDIKKSVQAVVKGIEQIVEEDEARRLGESVANVIELPPIKKA